MTCYVDPRSLTLSITKSEIDVAWLQSGTISRCTPSAFTYMSTNQFMLRRLNPVKEHSSIADIVITLYANPNTPFLLYTRM